jgi:hypothetical protein
VPLVLIDNRPLTEVAAILFYLARGFPDARLLPSTDVETEAQAVSWMSFVASTLHPARGWDRSPCGWTRATGRSVASRSPISICSGCTGGWSIPAAIERALGYELPN